MLKKSDIKKLVNEALAKNQKDLSEHLEICDILKPLEGKEINRRTLNPKRLGKFKLSERYGNLYIVGACEYGHCITQNSFGDNGLISVDKFHESDRLSMW